MSDRKPVEFRGNSLAALRQFPESARRRAGQQLDLLQRGREPDDWKPMNERFENIWDAIEETPAQAENMKLRSSLMLALKDHIVQSGMSQSKAAKLFGVTQPRISDLMRGRIDLFAIDSLVNMLAAAGMRIEMNIGKAA
jgi:predicted XRE-type DNA-binding protein